MATTAVPTAAPDTFRSIYSNGDLILVNPAQSTTIFISVIVASTILEFVIEKIQQAKNRYVRTIVTASKDEITNMSFVQMILLFVAFSFPLSASWRTVTQWVVMCLVYMCFAYVIMISSIMALLKVKSTQWRIFEWARIEADSHHSSSEQIFKAAREYFMLLVKKEIPDDADKLEDSSLVAFSTYLGRIERRNLSELTDFSFKTWFGLGLMIIVNGARAITVASTTEDDNLYQVFSFIGISGYGTLIPYLGAHVLFQRRFRRYLYAQIRPTMKEGEAQPEEDGDGFQQQERSARLEVKLDRSTTPQQCFFFRSMGSTLEIFKVTMLCMMWFAAVQVMAYTYVAWAEVRWFALLIYLAALIPILIFIYMLPWTMNLVLMCQALSDGFDVDLVKRLLSDDDQVSESDSDEEESNDGDEESDDEADSEDDGKGGGRGGAAKSPSPKRGRGSAPRNDGFSDEWDGPEVTMYSSVAPEAAPRGEPTRPIGVAPRARYTRQDSRPVFFQSGKEKPNTTPLPTFGSSVNSRTMNDRRMEGDF